MKMIDPDTLVKDDGMCLIAKTDFLKYMEYKELEEKGRLIIIPFEIGATLYEIVDGCMVTPPDECDKISDEDCDSWNCPYINELHIREHVTNKENAYNYYQAMKRSNRLFFLNKESAERAINEQPKNELLKIIHDGLE